MTETVQQTGSGNGLYYRPGKRQTQKQSSTQEQLGIILHCTVPSHPNHHGPILCLPCNSSYKPRDLLRGQLREMVEPCTPAGHLFTFPDLCHTAPAKIWHSSVLSLRHGQRKHQWRKHHGFLVQHAPSQLGHHSCQLLKLVLLALQVHPTGAYCPLGIVIVSIRVSLPVMI